MPAPQTLPFDRRDEFDSAIFARPLSNDGRRFLQLMFTAANGTPPADSIAGTFTRIPEPMFVLTCTAGQQALAEAAGLPGDRELRRTCAELESIGILRRTTISPNGSRGRETSYFLSLRRLLELPELDIETPIGRALQAALSRNPFDDKPEPEDLEEDSPSFAGDPPEVRRRTAGGSPEVRRSHHHDNYLNSTVSKTHDHDQTGPAKTLAAIPEADVRTIAGFATGSRTPTRQERLELFGRYWHAAQLDTPPPQESERIELLALFLHFANVKTNRSRGAAVATWWRNRHTRPLAATITPATLRTAQALAAGRPESSPVRPPAPQTPAERCRSLDLSTIRANIARNRPRILSPAESIPEE